MSIHELEDLVEMSVRVLDSCQSDATSDRRSMFYHLYDFQGKWDTGFTHFRVMDILIAHRFVYQMDMTAHPDYAKYQIPLDQIVEDSKQSSRLNAVKFMRLDPSNDPDSKALSQMSIKERKDFHLNNPYAGYYRDPLLYADAGSPLWKRLVEVGQLTGADAEAPNPQLTLIDIANQIIQCAEKQQNYDVMVYWYALLPYHLMNNEISQQTITPAFESILNTIHSCNALNRSTEHAGYLKHYIQPLSKAKTAKDYLKAMQKMTTMD